jgi:hypothetical protein
VNTNPVSRALRERRILFGVTFAAAFVAFLGPLIAFDLWWHLKAGRLILELGAVPRTDPFSFTAYGQPWTYHSWLAGLAFTLVHQVAGTTGLVLLRSLLMALSLMLAWVAARRRGVDAGLTSVLVLAACLQLKVRALARPYLFSFVLFMLFVLILQECSARPLWRVRRRLRRARRKLPWLAMEDSYLWGSGGRLLALPLLTVLWANLHAGFVSGLLLIGAFGVGEMMEILTRSGVRGWGRGLFKDAVGARFRAMLVAGVLCLAASVITPMGPATLLYPFRLLHGVKLVKRIQEWQPTPMGGAFAVFWALVALGVLVLVRSLYFSLRARGRRVPVAQIVTDVLLVGGFVVLAAQAARHMAWYLLLVPSVLGRHLEVSRRLLPGAGREDSGQGRLLFALVAYLLAFVVGALPLLRGGLPQLGASEWRLPVGACDYVEAQGLTCRPYNSYEWGGYLIWRFWPQMHVFVDGRSLLYGDNIIGEAIRVEDGEPGWEEVLEARDVEMLMVRYRKKDSVHLFGDGRWRCVYWDDVAVVALREDVLRTRRPELEELRFSNPVLLEEALRRHPPAHVLAELDEVLARRPDCWTAQAFRARCLVRLAREGTEERGALLRAALASARQAVRLQEGHREPWLALQEAARASGQEKLASRAARKVEALGPSPAD